MHKVPPLVYTNQLKENHHAQLLYYPTPERTASHRCCVKNVVCYTFPFPCKMNPGEVWPCDRQSLNFSMIFGRNRWDVADYFTAQGWGGRYFSPASLDFLFSKGWAIGQGRRPSHHSWVNNHISWSPSLCVCECRYWSSKNASEANVHMLNTFGPAVIPELAFTKCLP